MALENALALHVTGFLSGQELARGERVCVRWRQLCGSRAAWRCALTNEFPAAVAGGGESPKEVFVRCWQERRREEEAEVERLRQAAAHEALERGRPRWRPLKRALWLIMHPATNLLYVVPFLLLNVLLPLRLDGAIESRWTQVFSPMVAVGALWLLQSVAILVAQLQWPYLFEGLPFKALLGEVVSLMLDNKAAPTAACAVSTVSWMGFFVVAGIKADTPSFGMSWVAVTALLVLPLLAVAMVVVYLYIKMRDEAAEDAGAALLRVGVAACLPALTGLLATCMLAAANGDGIVAGESELRYPWGIVFLPLLLGTCLFSCSVCTPACCVRDRAERNQRLLFQPLAWWALTIYLSPFVIFEALLFAKLVGEYDISFVRMFICFFVPSGMILLSLPGTMIAIIQD